MRETRKTEPKRGEPTLPELRQEIDRIDEAVHGLLIERGEIISSLIAVKRTQESGSAFRPAREAAMMRRLVERHRGLLPLDTIESIWRVIISTFTFVQANYAVHADMSAGDALMRDSARFHFGFTVPLKPHVGAAAVVAAVAASKGDLGLVPASALAGGGAWWTALEPIEAPKIIARLPFVERPDHPASLPVFVVSKPLVADAAINEVQIFSVAVAGWNAATARAISPLAEVIAVPLGAYDGAALLLSLPPGRKLDEITGALTAAGGSVRSSALVGGHATRYTLPPAGERKKKSGVSS
ncbi:MAG TPA: chorismate mutase [Xanthobacteraceae bacterium]|nr:chorismate mutase [Xanthobacteraceae bacterium]